MSRRVTLAWLAVAIVYLTLMILAVTSVPSPAAVHTSRGGVRFITGFEGYFASPYLDPVGVVTQCYGATGAEMLTLPPRATEAQCRAQLARSLARTYEPPVRALFLPGGPLRGLFNQHRFDALVSADYNLGVGLVQCAYSSMCAAIGSRSPRAIAAALLLYDHGLGGGVLPGLTRRRHAEAALFLKPMGRFELFARGEVALIRRFDRLRSHRSTRAHTARVDLQRQMSRRAARLRHAIHREHDALTRRRAVRLAALERRVPHATTGGTP